MKPALRMVWVLLVLERQGRGQPAREGPVPEQRMTPAPPAVPEAWAGRRVEQALKVQPVPWVPCWLRSRAEWPASSPLQPEAPASGPGRAQEQA
jgi:hypothetical protein